MSELKRIQQARARLDIEEARYRYDSGMPMSMRFVAIIKKVSLQAARNHFSKSGIKADKDGMIPFANAVAYISKTRSAGQRQRAATQSRESYENKSGRLCIADGAARGMFKRR